MGTMNCDRIARWYQVMEYFTLGPTLERRRREFIGEIADAKRALILGDGDGRFTAKFLKVSKACSVDCVELSAEMIRQARRRTERIPTQAAVRFLNGDVMTVALEGPYDLIVSHFFLDCFTTAQVEQLVQRLVEVAPGARWVISEFRIPANGVASLAGSLLIGLLYRIFRWFTGLQVNRLSDYPQVFRKLGFEQRQSRSALGGILVSELWQIN